jgi:hypothetical protein
MCLLPICYVIRQFGFITSNQARISAFCMLNQAYQDTPSNGGLAADKAASSLSLA